MLYTRGRHRQRIVDGKKPSRVDVQAWMSFEVVLQSAFHFETLDFSLITQLTKDVQQHQAHKHDRLAVVHQGVATFSAKFNTMIPVPSPGG